MSTEGLPLAAGLGVAELDGPVVASGGERLAVGQKRDRFNRSLMPAEGLPQAAVLHRGDIVLVNFPFSSGTGSKLRPALQSDHNNQRLTTNVIVGAITTTTRRHHEPTAGTTQSPSQTYWS